MSAPQATLITDDNLLYIVNHVSLPPKLPQESDQDNGHELSLCKLLVDSAQEYQRSLPADRRQEWLPIVRMLKNLLKSTDGFSETQLKRSISGMQRGDVLVLHIRAQNSALVLRKLEHRTIFEIFEASPSNAAVMESTGKLICSFPGPAIEIDDATVSDKDFLEQFASFLVHMNVDLLDSVITTRKAGSEVSEERDTVHPQYISQLLIGILRGLGTIADVRRIRKRIADDVLWKDAFKPWRRSPLWLIIRVSIQTSLTRLEEYKSFMLFLHAQILQLCARKQFPSDLIFCARAKMARRAYKLGDRTPNFVLQAVENAMNATEAVLQNRWTTLQRSQAIAPPWNPSHICGDLDSQLTLPHSRDYIAKLLHRDFTLSISSTFQPDHYPRLKETSDLRLLTQQKLKDAFSADRNVALADFEILIQDHLDEWVANNMHDESTLVKVATFMDEYIDAALICYYSNAEDQSRMILTILEMWVAIDTLVLVQCPLLRGYSPEIPVTFLEPLLLRRGTSLQRAIRIEQYLRHRYANTSSHISIFSDKLDATSFCIRYFDDSTHLQDLQTEIRAKASEEREKKCKELRTKNASYQELMDQASSMDYEPDASSRGKRRLGNSCKRTQLEKRANRMRIDVHEWPLPADELSAKAVVFELHCPTSFAIWRDSTYKILRDIGMSEKSAPSAKPHVVLTKDAALAKLAKPTQWRITFGSSTKSFTQSHYRRKRIPATKEDVCVNSGLRYQLYDRLHDAWASNSIVTPNVAHRCILSLDKGPYGYLQYAVDGTSHTSNHTIASQSECPPELSLHEHIAFAGLRIGPRLQWLNIIRELSTTSLTFKREEVHSLIMQAAWQIGPLSEDGVLREWHYELTEVHFGLALLGELRRLLRSIESNWTEVATVRTIIFLAGRLIASASDRSLMLTAFDILRLARDVTFRWMHELIDKLQSSDKADQVHNLQTRICNVAATCRATYDVDPAHLPFLFSSMDDIAVLVGCAIALHSHLPASVQNEPSSFKKLLARDHHLSQLLEVFLWERIVQDRQGLDKAITSIWPVYMPTTEKWKRLSGHNSRWITTVSAASNTRKQRVHFNLLDGAFLVDGQPLGRLPRSIIESPAYARIFGEKVFDVVPADMSSMTFATRIPISGYQVLFAVPDDELIIRVRQVASGEVYEIIRHDALVGDFPTKFVDGFAHWLSLSTGEIEFRPLSNLWESSPRNWHLGFFVDRPCYMIQGNSSLRLVDIHGESFAMIARRLQPLEYAQFLTVVYAPEARQISVHLPRYRLSFSVNSEGELASQNLLGMVVDQDQSSGTMFGLRNQLVLRVKASTASEHDGIRHVLIPHGRIDFGLEGDHVNVTIDTLSQDQVSYYNYKINTDLGYLTTNVSLRSKLYKILLHALCSHCLPDPLTRRSGTEEALQELRSASCLSFQSLTTVEIELLHQIATLTPTRQFYPRHLHVMQTIEWSKLSPLSQHDGFCSAVYELLAYARNLGIYGTMPSDMDLSDPQNGSQQLLERAAARNAVYYTDNLLGQLPAMQRDSRYYARDISDDTGLQDELEVCKSSRMVHSLTPKTTPPLLKAIKSWGSTLSGTHQSGLSLSLSYSKKWLQPDLSDWLLRIYDLCRHSKKGAKAAKFELGFSLPAMAYRSPHLRPIIPLILSFLTIPDFRCLEPPSYSSYDLSDGFEPATDCVRSMVFSAALSLEHSPAASELTRIEGESLTDFDTRCTLYFKLHRHSQVDRFTDELMRQWPCTKPDTPSSDEYARWIEVSTCMAEVHGIFESCTRNVHLREFISRIDDVLRNTHHSSVIVSKPSLYTFKASLDLSLPTPSRPALTLDDIICSHPPGILPPTPECPLFVTTTSRTKRRPGGTGALQRIFSEFRYNTHDQLHQRYGEDMERSREELDGTEVTVVSEKNRSLDALLQHRLRCSKHVQSVFNSISYALSARKPKDHVIAKAGLWPCISPRTVLSLLSSTRRTELPSSWKEVLTSYAQTIVEYQQSQRLVDLVLSDKTEDLFKELETAVSDEAPASSHADWLLIQIDGNFRARRLQTRVAEEMIAPSSGQNAVIQLNMGEGKSSVIVPMTAVALANGRALVRVVVLKSLASQMFQLLVERLCGLANRRIFYMPFSRNVNVDDAGVALIVRQSYEQCLREGGILLVQPEHILSFKLMGLDRMFSAKDVGQKTAARAMIDTQKWLHTKSRDLLDESDELLHIRYQLIYTMGQQKPLEDHPDRWSTIQQVFSLVKHIAVTLKQEFPEEIELHMGSENSFPVIRIVGASASKVLVSTIARLALDGEIPNLGLALLPATVRAATFRFLTEVNVEQQEYLMVEDHCSGSDIWKGLLLLRGLLAHHILLYVLKDKRWRVDYGLDPSRSLLAVPYRAKDIPSLRAEFGHPDVAILLTCLSYYYGGLSEDQLLQCFQLLYQGDNPALDYELWVCCGDKIPLSLQRLDGVNTQDTKQFKQSIFPALCKNHGAINFFLSSVVFPKQAKAFPQKIATSGWNLSEAKTFVTTGFSGTNDNHYLLPTSIEQHDPVQQLSTNAQVLMYLLQLENDHYYCTHGSGDKPCSATDFLETLVHQVPEIRVLLDVGAQMLELQNRELASHWLSLRTDVSAAVFFDEADQLIVLTPDGMIESFVSSPFNRQLDKCIVYLDDAHTRGTDLRLPKNFRAAVTLGPKVTKDRLIQGCMRMRKLGNGQSVMFFAPLEVDRRIREAAHASASDAVKVPDILRWAMLETCEDIRHHIPHWAQQGIDYKQHNEADLAFTSDNDTHALKAAWCQSEARTLEDMYGKHANAGHLLYTSACQTPEMRERFEQLGISSLSDPRMEEEQEREVSHETKRERQVERPQCNQPAQHRLPSALRTFVRIGQIPHDSPEFIPLFRPLDPGLSLHDSGPWSHHLFATADFMTTVLLDDVSGITEYLRPVNWVISSTKDTALLVVLSPYEVNALLPEIRRSTAVHLHIYAPRVTQAMRPLNNLNLYSIPPLPRSGWVPPPRIVQSQLSLWAGELYLNDYETYLELCAFLGVYTTPGTEGVQSDGFVKPSRRTGRLLEECTFKESPMPLLKTLVGMRRKGMSYLGTHMGKMLHARLLTMEDFL